MSGVGALLPPDVALVIFDADGTLRRTTVPGKPCPHGPDEWEPVPGVAEALAAVRWGAGGIHAGVASNQDHVHYGHLTSAMAHRLLEDALFAATGHRAPADAIQFCPHAMDGACGCRKPSPALLFRIMRHYAVAPGRTLFVGDAEVDREAATRAGVRFRRAADFLHGVAGPHA